MSPARPPVPARVAWTLDLLDLRPDDEVLELGCGPGVAVAEVCSRLDGGRITALDRSATAIERTRSRNAAYVAAGLVVLHQVDIASFRGPPRQFHKAFAINVNQFWTADAAAECAVLKHVLRPEGVLRLVYDAPSPSVARRTGQVVARNLKGHGFGTAVTPSPTSTMICVVGLSRA